MGAKGAESDDKDARFGGQFSQMYNTYSSSVYTIQVQFQLNQLSRQILASILRSVKPQKHYNSQTQAAIRGTDLGISVFARVYSRFMRLLNLLVQAKVSWPIAFGVLIDNYGGVHHPVGPTKINPRSGMRYAIVQIAMRLNDKRLRSRPYQVSQFERPLRPHQPNPTRIYGNVKRRTV